MTWCGAGIFCFCLRNKRGTDFIVDYWASLVVVAEVNYAVREFDWEAGLRSHESNRMMEASDEGGSRKFPCRT